MNNLNDFNKRSDGTIVNNNKRDYQRAKKRKHMFKSQNVIDTNINIIKEENKELKDFKKDADNKISNLESQVNTLMESMQQLLSSQEEGN